MTQLLLQCSWEAKPITKGWQMAYLVNIREGVEASRLLCTGLDRSGYLSKAGDQLAIAELVRGLTQNGNDSDTLLSSFARARP